jgi:3-oxochol-4-en-24-oyl-CoA dehydrogenase
MHATEDIWEALRQSATDFLSRRQEESRAPFDTSVAPTVDRQLWREVSELGWLGLGLPEALGGSELGLSEAALIAEQLGRVASALPYVAASVMPSVLMAQCEPTPHLRGWAAQLLGGEALCALAWQEHSRELAPQLPKTSLVDGRLTGSKRFVVAAETDSVLFVTVEHSGSLAIVAVNAQSPGITLERYAAGAASEATVHFDGAAVLTDPIAIGERAEQALGATLRAGRVALSANLGGLASGLLDKTMVYIGDRVQFARPISSFQVIRHRCVDLYISTRLATATWQHAVRSIESIEADSIVSAAKARCGDVAVQVGREAVQMHGAMGFIEDTGVGRYLRASLHGRAWLGTPLAHRRRFMALQSQRVANHD